MRDNDGADLLEIYFTAQPTAVAMLVEKAGEVELVSGGKTRLVTDANKEEYLRRMVRHHTVGRMGLAAKVVRQGLEAVVNPLVVDLFSEQDLCVLLQNLPSMWPIGRIIQSIIAVAARPHHRLAMALDKGNE